MCIVRYSLDSRHIIIISMYAKTKAFNFECMHVGVCTVELVILGGNYYVSGFRG